MQLLVERLAVKRILTNNIMAEDFDLFGGRACVASADTVNPFVGNNLEKGVPDRPCFVERDAPAPILTATQTRNLGEFWYADWTFVPLEGEQFHLSNLHV